MIQRRMNEKKNTEVSHVRACRKEIAQIEAEIATFLFMSHSL